MMAIRTILVAAMAISAGASLAADDAERDFCGKLLDPQNCGREIGRIERYLMARDAESSRTGQGYNTSASLVGCAVQCARRHVGYIATDEQPDGSCTYSAAAMRRFEGLNQKLHQARVIEAIRNRCSGK